MSEPVDTIADRIRAYITASARLATPPGDHDSLVERGFIASLRLLDLVGFLEDEFDIALRPVDLAPEKLATIAELAAMVRSRLTASRRSPRASS